MRKKAQKIPALQGENGFAYSDSIKAETIALSLEKQFSLNDLSQRETQNEVKKSTENFSSLPLTNNQTNNLKCIQPSEVIKVIKNLNIKKACGLDCITNKMLKKLPCTMIFKFTEIINNTFKFNYFPKAWKTAVVVPILKHGKDPTQLENYRPISLLSTLSKLTENFILDKLNKHLAKNKILCPEQFGFRKSLTTTHQLLRVVEYITSSFEKGECTGAVFLDVEKAFDRVWIQGLIPKLIRYKTPPHLLQLLKSYLKERKFAVKIGNSISEAKIMRAGIPQGGKISPVVYSLYVNDIPKTHKILLGTSSCSAPATIPQDPDRSHPHILCLQQQQQTIQLPELKVSSIANAGNPFGDHGPQKLLVYCYFRPISVWRSRSLHAHAYWKQALRMHKLTQGLRRGRAASLHCLTFLLQRHGEMNGV
ncbi:putative RNA-directed DNA polymerase from transposon BS [Araneus ventricosus]|uniref:Putative RNA-directed DNA polymerase from transposon BS n=1 Tax=Araneus ventricosus TaxID=182803 RepID=A0A4Y2URG2_ARAVE|nr:putative RNA-directed DNA polymerase from transposon BS [Araneus ventricosus]